MTKAARLQREGVLPNIDDPLVLELAKAWDKCSEKFGALSCDSCPVREKCQRLWSEIVDTTTHVLNLTEYRKFNQKFYLLEQERDRLLASSDKPT